MKYLLLLAFFAFSTFLGCKSSPNLVPAKTTSDAKNVEQLSVFQLPTKWKTQANQEISLAHFKGKVVVLAMIYTTCTFSCPRLVADMKRLESALPADEKKHVQLVLVSIDPEHDTPEVLTKFAQERKMPPSQWTLLQGTKDDVQEIAAVLGFKYKKITPVDFSHSNLLSVFDAEGVLAYQQEGIAADQQEMVNKIGTLTENL
jgi:protein SCO1/2